MSLIPGYRHLTRPMRRSLASLIGVLVMFIAIPVLVPAPAGMFNEPHPELSLSAPVAQAAAAPAPTPAPTAPVGIAVAPYGTYANPYYRGNCTYYVASRRQVPTNWHNAVNWYGAAQRAGWSTGATPQIGAIAWTGAGWAGHVALVDQIDGNRVLISEMNYYGYNRIDQRWVSASSFRYIY